MRGGRRYLELHDLLVSASERSAIPTVINYNRIDGPGSSLDLREFQQALWSMPEIPDNMEGDPAMGWTRLLPRTVGITIDIGTKVEAHPFKQGYIGVKSIDYGIEVEGKPGAIPPRKENWMLKVLDLFGLKGVKFVLKNLYEDTKSAGLGGSSTAITGVCILANELAGCPMSPTQLISLSSRMEQDLGVSITGTQEQSNVLYGGVTDYIWFPWGIPRRPETGYGESIRTELVPPRRYGELEERMAIYHTGKQRASMDVNSVWRDALMTAEGYKLHSLKLELAYLFREGLRLGEWEQVHDSISKYCRIRTTLCSQYMSGSKDLTRHAKANGCAVFPLGAGGGGAVFVFSPDPDGLEALGEEPGGSCRKIPFKIRSKGHELYNMPGELPQPK